MDLSQFLRRRLTLTLYARILLNLRGRVMSDLDLLVLNATQLPVPERLELIDAIWATLPEEALPPLSDEWMAEIKRRSADFEAGRTHAISWETVRAEAIARLRGSPEAS